jgi:hypothetical protein
MGRVFPIGKWVRAQRHAEQARCLELLNEGDGNVVLRSSLNRDRQLRLSWEELNQLGDMILWPSRVAAAPELVSHGR